MKILTFTDTHLHKAAYKQIKEKVIKENPDLLICCGDISWFGEGLDESAKFLNSLNKTCLIIPGNHETGFEIKEICIKYKNLINLHKGSYEFENFLFFGYGTGGFSFRDEKFERISKEFIKTLDKSKHFVFVTHAPIYKTKLDELWGEHRGNNSSREFIEKTKPIITLCGHFHENEGKQDKIKNTLILNPGKFGKIINV